MDPSTSERYRSFVSRLNDKVVDKLDYCSLGFN